MSPRQLKTDPRIIEMPAQKMAVVRGRGSPDKVFTEAMPALYGSVYTLKFDLKKRGLLSFKVEAARARYADANTAPKDKWTIAIGLPIPEDTVSMPQKVAEKTVAIETWSYGTVAQVLHLGAYGQETPTIQKLHEFINANGYEVAGDHEEEYLSRPDAKIVKTVIRYPIRKKA